MARMHGTYPTVSYIYKTDIYIYMPRRTEQSTQHPRSVAMQQPADINLGPNSTSKHPPAPPLVGREAGANRAAWSRSGHLAVLPGRSRHARALAVAPSNSSLSLQCNAGKKNICKDTEPRVEKFFEVEMSVRDCELDHYGVVSNAIYSVYIDKAREELAASLCISTGSLACSGHAMALSDLNLKYLTPLRSGDRFVVKVRLVQIKGAKILMKHLIETLPDRKLVLEATATVVCLNGDYRPTRVFPEMSSKLQQRFFSPGLDA